jgi:urease accessory protein UreF
MGLAATEKELADKTARYLKAELKRAGVTYAELAKRLADHGLEETEDSVSSKLARGTFPATFFLAALAAVEKKEMRLEEL